MPIYEYSCKKCAHQFEVLIRSNSDYPGKCPKCGAPKPAKMLSAFAVSSASASDDLHCTSCPGADRGCAHASGDTPGCPRQ
jgi:putative FmdB family regulatory protein